VVFAANATRLGCEERPAKPRSKFARGPRAITRAGPGRAVFERRFILDEGERLAESEIAAQASADLLVRQAGACRVDDGTEDVLCLVFGGARQAFERGVDGGRRALRLPGREGVEMALHGGRVGALDGRARRGVLLGAVGIDADDLIAEVSLSKLLQGVRGAPPSDRNALHEAILRLSAMLDTCPEIREIDLNPLKVLEHGVSAVDARIRVEAIAAGPPSRRVAY